MNPQNQPINFKLSTVQTILPPPADNKRRPFLTPIPNEQGSFLLVLDNTSLEKIKRCHKAAENYLVLGREAHARNAALTFGGAIHEGLELFHHWQYNKDRRTDRDDLIANDEGYGDRMQNEAIRRFFELNPAPPDEYRTVATALEVLKHYRLRSDPLRHPDYEWEIMADQNGPIIERAFELPMGVLEIEVSQALMESLNHGYVFADSNRYTIRIHLAWSGRIDLIARVNSRVRICDHKTSSIDGEQFVQSFQLSSQTIGYVWAARQLFPNLDVSGFCLNCIRLKRPTGSVGIMERGPRGGDPALAFFRAYFDYSPERIDRWERDTVLLIEDFLHSLARGVFPLNDRQCFDKFGKCAYHDCCTIDNEKVGHALLMSDAFKQVTWNPTT